MFTSSRRFRSSFIAHYSLPKNPFLMFLCLILLAGFARFAWVKNSDAARRRPYILTTHAYYHLVMLNLFQHLTASLFLSFSADRSWNELFAFAHRKHLIFFWMRYGQDDICVLTAHRSSLIACHWKFFTKLNFCINPVGKSKVPSWKIFISQLVTMFAPR